MKKILLLDGNGLIFRAYFATATRMSVSSNGTPTNALYLFASIIMRLIEKKDFDDILVALDSPGKKFRHKEYVDYKANRKEVPTELKLQFAPIKEFLNICNIKTIEIEGYEAFLVAIYDPSKVKVISKEVLGTDDPTEVQAALSNWDNFDATAAKMKEAGYFMTSSAVGISFKTIDDVFFACKVSNNIPKNQGKNRLYSGKPGIFLCASALQLGR